MLALPWNKPRTGEREVEKRKVVREIGREEREGTCILCQRKGQSQLPK